MTAPPILIHEAKADVTEAYQWYDEQSPGLGMDFLRCVEAALFSIQRAPLSYPTVHETYRRSLVRRFPFAIFFEFVPDQDRCIVYSVFHCSQNPKKWRSRCRPGGRPAPG
jgi:hypothetical protein